MFVPATFYGRYIDVRKRMLTISQGLQCDKAFCELFVDRRSVDTGLIESCYLTLFTMRDLSIAKSHFHFTLLREALTEITGTPDHPVAQRVFEELITKDWGVLVFADENDAWFGETLAGDNRHRHRPYLSAVLRYARFLTREGKRFVNNKGRAGTFWEANSALRAVLMAEGISASRLKEGFGEAAFTAMCRELGIEARTESEVLRAGVH